MGMVHIKTNQSFTPVAGRKYKLLLGSGGSGGGGGGSGNSQYGGNGGSGGNGNELPFQWIAPDNTPIACTIGQGGSGGTAGIDNNRPGGNGGAGGTTSFGSIVSVSGPKGGALGGVFGQAPVPHSPNFGVKVTVGGNGGTGGMAGNIGYHLPTAGIAGTQGGIFIAWND